MGSRSRGSLLFASVAAATIAVDQLSKQAAIRALPEAGDRWPGAEAAVSRVFTFTHVHNTGMAFGLGQGNSGFFLVLALVVVAALAVWQWRLPPEDGLSRVGLGLVAGGALGNAIDRMRLGYVTDFLDFQVWPVFNLADTAIFLGVGALGLALWREERARRAAESAVAEAAAVETAARHGTPNEASHAEAAPAREAGPAPEAGPAGDGGD